ncbi:MAG: AsmA family protein [Myxococcaceae bacterium]|nr:AsmA family protein [Myxococcaceae bacterium]
MERAFRRPKSAARRVAVVVVGVLVVGIAAFGVLIALIDSDAVAARVKDAVLPKLSERIGREVTLDEAHARLFPRPRVTLEHLVVHGLPTEPALVETERAEVDLRLWPLIRSFGHEVRVDAVSVVRPELNLVRKKDGSWNFEGLASAPPSERDVRIARIDVTGGQVRIVDRSAAAGEATVALRQIDLRMRNVGFGRKLSVVGTGAFASEAQNLRVELKTSPVRRGEWPELQGTLALEGAQLTRLGGVIPAKLAEVVTGGQLGLKLEVATKDGRYALEGDGRADAVRLRGEPARAGFHVKTVVEPARAGTSTLEFSRLYVQGPGLNLAGSAHASLAPRAVQFSLQGALLDLDQLLGALPHQTSQAPRAALLPAKVREQLENLAVRGRLKIDRVVDGRVTLEHLDAEAVLHDGVLSFEAASADLYGGRVDASGTTAQLTPAVPRWNLRARLQQLDVERAMAAVSGAAPLQGRVDAALDLRGEGADWATIRRALTGTGTIALRDGVLTTADLGAQIGPAVTEALRLLSQPKAAATVDRTEGGTRLENLTASFRVRDGWMELSEPLVFTSPFGGARLSGRIGLDQRLALRGDVVLSKSFIPQGPFTIPVTIGGTLKKPALTGIDAKAASRMAGRQVEEQVERQAREKAGEFLRRLGGGR